MKIGKLAFTVDPGEILEWDPTNKEWKELGKMKHARERHAAAVVDVADVMDYCT